MTTEYSTTMDLKFDELPDGRLICHNHGLVVCDKCCLDFSFAGPGSSEFDDEDEEDEEGSLIDASECPAFLFFVD